MTTMVFCRGCGGQIHESAPMCPKCGALQGIASAADDNDQTPRTFANSITICMSRYARFRGRAPRAEFWYFTILYFVVIWGADLVSAVWLGSVSSIFSWIVNLAFFLPGLAVQVRRFHDLNKSGWWWFLICLPVVGWIILLVWNCTVGTRGPNRYGVDPLANHLALVAVAAL